MGRCALRVSPTFTAYSYARLVHSANCHRRHESRARALAARNMQGMRGSGLQPRVRVQQATGKQMTWRSGLQRSEQRASIRCNAIDPWSVNAESLASQLFAVSLFPYLAFLFFLNKAKGQPMVNFGFAFLLVFVFATIPAGIYAKKMYGTSLANVDWLHGGAESLLTITNILIVLGLRQKLQQIADQKKEGGGDEAPK